MYFLCYDIDVTLWGNQKKDHVQHLLLIALYSHWPSQQYFQIEDVDSGFSAFTDMSSQLKEFEVKSGDF
jgi:hypothetical protein